MNTLRFKMWLGWTLLVATEKRHGWGSAFQLICIVFANHYLFAKWQDLVGLICFGTLRASSKQS